MLSEFARRCGITRSWAYKLAEGGAIKTIRLGRYFYIQLEHANEWIEKFKKQGSYHTFPRMTRSGLVEPSDTKGVETPM